VKAQTSEPQNKTIAILVMAADPVRGSRLPVSRVTGKRGRLAVEPIRPRVTHFAIEGAAVMGAVCASAPASGLPVYCPRIESMRCSHGWSAYPLHLLLAAASGP
jgi:hypothetical protein